MSKEKLFKRSDGFVETSDGLFAVSVRAKYRNAAADSDVKEFTFVPSYLSSAITIQWRGDLAYLPQDLATVLVRKGYAENPTDEDVEFYSTQMKVADTSSGDDQAADQQPVPDDTVTVTDDAEKTVEDKSDGVETSSGDDQAPKEKGRRGRPPKSAN